MSDRVKMILLGVTALIVGLAVGGGYGLLQVNEMKLTVMSVTQDKDRAVQNMDRMLKMNDAAATKYSKVLGPLVMAAATPALAVPSAAAPAQSQGAPDLPAATSARSQTAPDLPAGSATAPAPVALDPVKLIDEARAILAARDGLRGSLDGARVAMNSEFDALAAELGAAAPDASKVKQILESLKQSWPRKEIELEAATRRLLVDLGLQQAALPPKLAPAAAAPMAPASATAPVAPAPSPAAKK